ncbi:M23 family metallopeptidase, partial [Nanoarchaeota archaeon]
MNKKGSFYAMLIMVLLISFMLITFFKLSSRDQLLGGSAHQRHIGEEQGAIMTAILEGEEALLYVDQAAMYAVKDAKLNFNTKGADLDDVGDGDDAPSSVVKSACGAYVYNQWSTTDMFCPPPDPKTTYERHLNVSIESELASSVYAFPPDNYNYELEKTDAGYLVRGIAKQPVKIPMTAHHITKKYEGDIVWPVDNTKLTSCYGRRTFGDGFHDGIDFTSQNNAIIKSIAPGEIVEVCNRQPFNVYDKYGACDASAQKPCYGFGNYVLIKHSESFYSRYSHMQFNSIRGLLVGQQVALGQNIGVIGDTGCSAGAHLDLKIYKGGNFAGDDRGDAINPLCYYSDRLLSDLDAYNTNGNCFVNGEKVFDAREKFDQACARIDFDTVNQVAATSETSYSNRSVGYYEVWPHFKVTTDLVIPGADEQPMHESVVEWARNTWESCEMSPQACLE